MTQFLHRLQIIGRYLEKIKGEMKVFRNFIFLSFYPSKMGKSESKPAYQKGTPIPKDPEGILRIFFWGFLIPALSVLERPFFQPNLTFSSCVPAQPYHNFSLSARKKTALAKW